MSQRSQPIVPPDADFKNEPLTSLRYNLAESLDKYIKYDD